MSKSLDAQRILDHCILNIEGATDAIANDMHDAAMKLGTAAMMLASASHAIHRHAAQLPQVPAQPDTGRTLDGQGPDTGQG